MARFPGCADYSGEGWGLSNILVGSHTKWERARVSRGEANGLTTKRAKATYRRLDRA